MRRLAHSSVGKPPPELVFCHGFLGRGNNLSPIARALRPRSSLLLDLPNHGRSYWATSIDYLDMADAVAGAIRRSGSDRVTLVGHSMGGKVAMLVALGHRDLVSRLCVIDISPQGRGVSAQFGPLLAALRSLDLEALKSRTEADEILARTIPQKRIRSFLLQNLARDGDSWRWQANIPLLGDDLEAVGDWPDLGLPPYEGPVSWIRGERSGYVADEDLPLMRQYFPQVQLVTVPGASHWVHAEEPDAVVALIKDLLELPPAPTPEW